MNITMPEAANRLGAIIKKLGGGVSVSDQRELEALHDRMTGGTGRVPDPKPVKKAKAKKAAPKAVKPLKADPVKKPSTAAANAAKGLKAKGKTK